MINQVNIIGRITRDIEVKNYYDKNNVEKIIAKFSIAVNERGNQIEDKTYFFDCTAFGGLATNIIKYCGKGSLVAISGKLVQEVWEDKMAQKRSRVHIVVNECEFLSQKPQSSQEQKVQEEIYNQYYNQQYVQQPQPTQQYYYQQPTQPQYQQTIPQYPNPFEEPNPKQMMQDLGFKARNIEDEVGF